MTQHDKKKGRMKNFVARGLAWFLGAFFSGLVLVQIALVSAVVWINTVQGNSFLQKQVDKALSGTGYSLSFENVHYSMPTGISISLLQVHDQNGLLADVKNTVLHVGIFPLLRGQVLVAAEIEEVIYRAEDGGKQDVFDFSSGVLLPPVILPELYFSALRLDRILVHSLRIDDSGHDLSVDLYAALSMGDHEGVSAVSMEVGGQVRDQAGDDLYGVNFKGAFDPAKPSLNLAKLMVKTDVLDVSCGGCGEIRFDRLAQTHLLLRVTPHGGGDLSAIDLDVKGQDVGAEMSGALAGRAEMRGAYQGKDITANLDFTVHNAQSALLDFTVAPEELVTGIKQFHTRLEVRKEDEEFRGKGTVFVAGIKDREEVFPVDFEIGENKFILNAADVRGRFSGLHLDVGKVVATLNIKGVHLSSSGKGVLPDFVPFSVPVGQEISGDVFIQAGLAGERSRTFRIENGRYANMQANGVLDKISVNGAFLDDFSHVKLGEARAVYNGSGTLRVDGEVGLGGGLSGTDLKVRADGIHALKGEPADGVFSADLRLREEGGVMGLSGVVRSEEVNVKIPERFGASVPVLNVETSMSKKTKNLEMPSIAQAIALDVVLDIPRRIFVRGWGLDAELGGKIRIQGDLSSPYFTGQMKSLRGSYTEFGKRFEIVRADMNFDGNIPPTPDLDILAQTKTGDILAQVEIAGALQKPQIRFLSEPALPQDEVLSRILFGKDMQKITAFQAAQLAQTAQRFSGNGGAGFDPVGMLRGVTGLDDLRVEGDGDGGASVGAGKYLSDKVYLEFKGGSADKSGAANLSVEITPEIKLESEVGQDARGGAGILWKRDY